ncbi:recombinase family protein [Candidatus Kuenenbacteria bacterium]|nr:recombinase family protein [Candidatus Kuenenbacteria bacterium]
MQTQALNQTNQAIQIKESIRWCLYARKSTEADELQALSIDSQIKEALELAQAEKLNIVEIKKESHSAKDSGQRPVFNQLLADIRTGVFNGILCWAPDRLARNAGDLGSVVDLMDQGRLIEIRTHGQKFTNNPNEKFLLMILGSQAKLENDHRGENVKRGLRAKCEKGWRPGPPPLGYLHDKYSDKGDKKVFIDPKRSVYIKKIFEKVAHEQYSGRQIYRWLNNETDFKTKNNKKITLSMIYRILEDHYYTGEFEYPVGSDKWYQGNHDPIITKELFQKAREQLERDNIERSECKEFAFTKLIKCGHCGSGVTAEEKFKKLSNGSVNRYVYYGCTRSRDLNCKGGYLREEELIKQLCNIIDQIDLDELGIKNQFEQEIARYHRFSNSVLGIKLEPKQKETDMKNYAKYILKEGTTLEQRNLLSNLKSRLVMRNKEVKMEKNSNT